MEVWLIRHGLTAANLEERWQGKLDYPLSSQGIGQAKRLAGRLRREGPPDIFLCSDLLRARQTAEIITSGLSRRVLITPWLRECSWGIIEGMTRAEAAACYPLLWRHNLPPSKMDIPGRESDRRLIGRVRRVQKWLAGCASRYRSVGLVSHGRFINAFISTVLGLKPRHGWPFAPAPASLSRLRYDASTGRYRLLLFNDRCHLQG